MIELINLSKTYKSSSGDVNALDGITLRIEDGEIFGIIGLSGAGKSTLVRCINLLERPTNGEVLVDGKSMALLSQKELLKMRQSIGMIFQSFNLLEQRTVLKNVCFPMEIADVNKKEAKKRAMELLDLVGLAHRANAYPSQLSGGQKQRAAIARSLAMNPKYILCDEATSALDPANTESILNLLKEINHKMGVTIVVITHEMKIVEKICDRVAIIDQKKIAEIGKVSDVFANPVSSIAKELIMPHNQAMNTPISGNRRIRITFDGNNSNKPIISEMVLAANVPVNIMFADTKDVGGKAYGQMLLELPDKEEQAAKILSWLTQNGISYREEEK